MIAPTLADAYIAGWRTCRQQPTPVTDPNGLPPDQREAWCTGFRDAIMSPFDKKPYPRDAGYD